MAGEFATDFDGSSDYYTRGSGLTGAADGKKGIFSVFFRLDDGDGSNLAFIQSAGSFLLFRRSASNKITIVANTDVPAVKLSLVTSNTYTASSVWRNLLTSWDLSVPVAHLYIDDVSDKVETTLLDGTLDYTRTDWATGGNTVGTNLMDGALSELYFNTVEYRDFSVEANRRKFISAAGKPVPLGVTGELPTTNQPIIYSPDGNASVNKGSGGAFTERGAPVRIAGPGDKPSPAARIYEVLRGS